MSRRLLKLSTAVFALLAPLGLLVALFVVLRKPFNLASRLVILVSPYRKLLPFIVAQAKHETGNFTSAVFKRENNMFGMKNVESLGGQRKQLGSRGAAAPDGGHYQHYSNQVQCVRDYLLYLEARKFPTDIDTPDAFVKALVDRGYFGYNPTVEAKTIYLNAITRYAA